jgi:hypothetical protein
MFPAGLEPATFGFGGELNRLSEDLESAGFPVILHSPLSEANVSNPPLP